MALDGAFLYKLKTEIENKALNARVDKIFQPSKDELVLSMRASGFSGKLLLNAGGSAPRIQFTSFAPENPATPPMFCMLLRKILCGARLVSVEQLGLDRVVVLGFEALNEMGDRITPKLIIEIMGGRSNIIFTDSDMRIVDAVRRSDIEKANSRLIQPGAMYVAPTGQGKINILNSDAGEVVDRIKTMSGMTVSKALSSVIDGACPLVCREVASRACRDSEKPIDELNDEDFDKIKIYTARLADEIRSGGVPTLVSSPERLPLDFTYTNISQYGSAAVTSTASDYSELLDVFYAEREKAARIHRKSADMLKLLTTLCSRISRKLDAQRGDLSKCADREKFRIYGELIKSNLHAIPKGASCAVVQNYYDPELAEIKIPLNSAISPAANAQKYFKDYKKSYTAEQTLTELIKNGEQELVYLDTVFDSLTRASSDADLADIRDELENGGYIRRAGKNIKRQIKQTKPLEFISKDGITIFVGRNNRQNDQLTMRQADRDDIWLHVKDIPGSHVIIDSRGGTVSDSTLSEAAALAAYYSKAKGSSSVPVDYTTVRNVKKPAGAKPGMVIYETNRTIYVTSDKSALPCERTDG